MPLLPTLSLFLSLVVYGMLFRLCAWRTTLSVKALGLMFGLGAVGATVVSLYFQTIPMPFWENWQSVAAWRTAPLYEELAKASPAILLMLSARLSGRMSVADFALAGFMGGLGFQFVEDNFSRVLSSDIGSGWNHVWGLGYAVDKAGGVPMYWPGHYAYSGLVGLSLGIGARLWRNSPRRWLPGLAALIYSILQHQSWNYRLRGTAAISSWPALQDVLAFIVNGPLGLIILPVALVAAQIWETKLLAKANHPAQAELALPAESGTALGEIGETVRRSFYGRAAVVRIVTFFRSRRALALAEADADTAPADPIALPFAVLARSALVKSYPTVLTAERSSWLPAKADWAGIFKLMLRRYRLPLILGAISLPLFGIAPSLVAWMHGQTMRAILVLVSAAFVAWRVVAYRRTGSPEAATTRGEGLAVHRLQFALLCTSIVTTCLSLVSLFAHVKGMTPGSALYIVARFSRWGDWGGNMESLLAVAAAWAAGLATPENPDPDSAIDPVLVRGGGTQWISTGPARPQPVTDPSGPDPVEATPAAAPQASVPKDQLEMERVGEGASVAAATPAAPAMSAAELEEEAYFAEAAKEDGPVDPNSPREIMRRAMSGDPEAQAQWDELKAGKTASSRTDSVVESVLDVVNPAAAAIYKEIGGAETLKEAANLDWGEEIDDTANTMATAVGDSVAKAWDTAKTTAQGAYDLSQMSSDELAAMSGQIKEDFANSRAGKTLQGAADLATMDSDEFKAMTGQISDKAADALAERIAQGKQLVDGMTAEEALAHLGQARDAAGETLDEAQRALARQKQALWRADPEMVRAKIAEATVAAEELVLADAAGEGILSGLAKADEAIAAARGVDKAVDAGRTADQTIDALRATDEAVDATQLGRAEAATARGVAEEAPAAVPRNGAGETQVLPRTKAGQTQILGPEDGVGGIKPLSEPVPRGPYGEHRAPGHTQELDRAELPMDGKPPQGMNRQDVPNVPESSTPKDGHMTRYKEAPYEDDPNIHPRTGEKLPEGPEEIEDPLIRPLRPGHLGEEYNPLDEAYARIKGAEREAPSIGAAEERVAGGRDAAIARAHERYEEGLATARENLANPHLSERLNPDALRELEEAVKPENARSLEDFRRSAGMDPVPPSTPPPSGVNAPWSDAETHVPNRARDPLEDTVIEPPPKAPGNR